MRKTAANKPRSNSSDRQRGVAAVELALILPVMVLLLAMSLFFGRVFWHYTVAQKAAHDSARYMSGIALRDIASYRIDESLDVAQQILDIELAELNPGPEPMSAFVLCDDWPCDGLTRPNMVSVRVRMRMYDMFFGPLTEAITGERGLLITASVTMAYVGK